MTDIEVCFGKFNIFFGILGIQAFFKASKKPCKLNKKNQSTLIHITEYTKKYMQSKKLILKIHVRFFA